MGEVSNIPSSRWLSVDLLAQRLTLLEGETALGVYAVATGARGAGERNGSGGTPRGWHCVRARIGAGAPSGAVFVGRRWTGEVWTPTLHHDHPERDWILSRILWLSGLERGVNRLGAVDTMRRFIYIHGCPDSEPVGVPCSHGCVRMRNAAVIDLFDAVTGGTPVWIGPPWPTRPVPARAG
ncbi:L,D-transpeptidase [Halorhodospira halophila]|uniref:ErfK/YbiS/YcfS/YnhG family protein n=1 Tax=Halorhodospira halophila (strain DSM 244 / SL1) TaxID=349124 RepID=A1WWH5_HALHL|nr:L,D-transpeptidase [Halorhodospira halophila]ABM62037.1 ErfK/YbiS/YcfS/YnhG family protein [Halorhodospira halophila SL1]MBK1728422.1 L,D-transpeptidase [Halorhodospira halophila]